MKDITWIVVVTFTAMAFLYLIFEQIVLKKIRKQFKIVIHVNGTRGKSTVARYMDAIMREQGYRTFTKTTGTIPMMIHCNKKEERIKRLGRANIREQAQMMIKAYKEKADVLILECMAVDPLLQWHSENHLIRADINIITNIRHDHPLEMGDRLADIASALANTSSKTTIVISADQKHGDLIEQEVLKKKAKFVFAPPVVTNTPVPLMQENISVAVKTAEILGISQEVALKGISNYLPDPGAFKIISFGKTSFINALSANDPETTYALYQTVQKEYANKQLALLVNNRDDRPERTKQNIDLILKIKPHRVFIAGDNAHYVYRKIKQVSEARFFHSIEDLINEDGVFAFGNIGKQGFSILQACEEWRDDHGY